MVVFDHVGNPGSNGQRPVGQGQFNPELQFLPKQEGALHKNPAHAQIQGLGKRLESEALLPTGFGDEHPAGYFNLDALVPSFGLCHGQG